MRVTATRAKYASNKDAALKNGHEFPGSSEAGNRVLAKN